MREEGEKIRGEGEKIRGERDERCEESGVRDREVRREKIGYIEKKRSDRKDVE
jgi:hypothetical protein